MAPWCSQSAPTVVPQASTQRTSVALFRLHCSRLGCSIWCAGATAAGTRIAAEPVGAKTHDGAVSLQTRGVKSLTGACCISCTPWTDRHQPSGSAASSDVALRCLEFPYNQEKCRLWNLQYKHTFVPLLHLRWGRSRDVVVRASRTSCIAPRRLTIWVVSL